MSAPDWTAMQAGLLAWFRARLGNDDLGRPIPADWADEEGYQPPHGIHAELHILTIAERGQDHTVYAEDPSLDPGVDFVPTQRGQRRMTVSMVVESQYLKPASSAHVFIERVRAALRAPSSQAAFTALGLGLIRAEAIQRVEGVVDERRLVRAVMDVHFHYASEQTDELGATSWIRTVEGTVDLTRPDATPVGPQPFTATLETP
jgi:hypothetical protein